MSDKVLIRILLNDLPLFVNGMYGVDKDGRDMNESAMSLLHSSPVDGPTLPAFFSPLLEFRWPLFFLGPLSS